MSEKQTETSTGGQDMGPFKAGAPFKFTDVQSFQLAIQAYFDSCDCAITPTRLITARKYQRMYVNK
jgi:hypothetical protein